MDIFYLPRQVAVDGTGAPYAGAKLQFYREGTTTPLDTYSDSALTTPNTNPVVADSDGQFGPIYLGTSYDYKAVLSTSADVEIWTQDNIPNGTVDGAKIEAGTVTTAALAAESVTLPKLVDVTRGSFLVGGASNRPVELALGDGQVPIGVGTDIVAGSLPLPTGYKSGFTLALDTDADHDIQVASGVARDSSDSVNIVGSAMTKKIDASWAAGDDQGGMFTGSVANSTVYYFFAIVKDSDSSVDYGFDTSSTAANIPSGYTYYLKLDQLLTDGSANLINSMNGKFVSAEQTITTAGALTITHGLPSTPERINCYAILTNTSAEGSWTIGDEELAGFGPPDAASHGVSIEPSSTTLAIRYANAAQVFVAIHETTGTATNLTNAKWTCRFIAEV